ncbi:MAG: YebC/PmpR family DNA-binding transcriptional regulator [Planctomycetes bacterium]|nr:YebC/PmpR family DNA-binding transcriptional regulator [Planctomycetota bacterium]
MAGHSHWAGIKHHKAAQDKKRSKYFSKFSKAIMIAAKDGGGDPDQNLSLRYAIDRAKAGNMPNDSIDRAIKKGTGEFGDKRFEEVIYEGYGAGGVAILVEALTDNRNRTAPEMRFTFSKYGGNMANKGSVAFMFDRQGLLAVEGAPYDEVFEVAAEAGAEDVSDEDGMIAISTPPEAFAAVKAALVAKGYTLSTAELGFVPQNYVTLEGKDAESVETLVSMLEDNDDVQAVHHNMQLAE